MTSERHPEEIVRSLLADADADAEEIRRVRTALRQWDRGCFRAQQAALKTLRALRIALGDRPLDAPRSAAAEVVAIGERAPRLFVLREAAEDLDRYFLRTGLPLGSPQIHGEADFARAAADSEAIRAAARERLALGPSR